MKSVSTFTAQIFVGLKNSITGKIHPTDKAEEICQEYVDHLGLGLTFTRTRFIYTGGNEPGIIVGLINYPRFPSTVEKIKKTALELAEKLRVELDQKRCSVVMSDETVLLGDAGTVPVPKVLFDDMIHVCEIAVNPYHPDYDSLGPLAAALNVRLNYKEE